MGYLHQNVLDNGLAALVAATGLTLHICHTAPLTRANALSYSVGNKAGPSIGAIGARTPTGRKVTVAAVTDGTMTATATGAGDDAQYWAIIDGTILWAAGDLAASQLQTSGNVFTTNAFDIGIPAPA